MKEKNKLRIYILNRNLITQLRAIILLIMLLLLLRLPRYRAVNAPIFKGPERGSVAITVNVDWGEDCIPRMLKIFEEMDVRATFFLTGRWVKKFPNLTRVIYEKGHEIGNHGYEHLHPKRLSDEALRHLIKNNQLLLEEICGVRTTLFAPPYGEFDRRIVKIANQLGHEVIMWSVDTIDWQRPDPGVIVNRVRRKLEDGAIILMHPTEPTLQALPEIIKTVRNRNLKLVTVSELLKGGSKDED